MDLCVLGPSGIIFIALKDTTFQKKKINYDTKIMLNSITFVPIFSNLWNGLLHMSHPKLFNDYQKHKRRLNMHTKQIKHLFKHIDYYLDKVKFFEHENFKLNQIM
jgi:hypothetical protein